MYESLPLEHTYLLTRLLGSLAPAPASVDQSEGGSTTTLVGKSVFQTICGSWPDGDIVRRSAFLFQASNVCLGSSLNHLSSIDYRSLS